MVEYTKKRIFKIKRGGAKNIISASMSALPYSNGFFDFVVSNGVLHNANNFKEFNLAIREISRVLKNGGYLILNTFVNGNLKNEFIREKEYKYLYFTKKGLATVLLPMNKFKKIFLKSNLQLLSYQTKYIIVTTGKRRVFKGVFKKE